MKENTLFKLDLLESFYLQKPSRFGVTKQMMRSEKYQSKAKKALSQTRLEKQRHKLLTLSRNDAFDLIKKLKDEAFHKKIFFIETSLLRCITKVLKKEKQKLSQKLSQSSKLEEKEVASINKQIEDLEKLLSKEHSEILSVNIKHKIYKTLIKLFPKKIDLKTETFDSIPEDEIEFIKNMKETNPYKTNGDVINNILSKIYADKSVKEALDNIQSFEIIWGPKKYTKESNDEELDEFDEEVENDDSESENESDSESGNEGEDGDEDDNSTKPLANEDYEELYTDYKDYIAASSDEEGDEIDVPQLDPNVNYNEITDDEPSEDEEDNDDNEVSNSDGEVSEKTDNKRSIEEDDFFASKPTTKKSKKEEKKEKKSSKIQLPVLATGYYSGGESDDEDNRKDSLVDEITNPRKNRRGQRARQKIWEKKYGKTAKHVVKQHERDLSERERLKAEYEVRKAKREQKEIDRQRRDAERLEKKQKMQEKTIHPSWEAKLKQQESLKAKFSGKKITFD